MDGRQQSSSKMPSISTVPRQNYGVGRFTTPFTRLWPGVRMRSGIWSATKTMKLVWWPKSREKLWICSGSGTTLPHKRLSTNIWKWRVAKDGKGSSKIYDGFSVTNKYESRYTLIMHIIFWREKSSVCSFALFVAEAGFGTVDSFSSFFL